MSKTKYIIGAGLVTAVVVGGGFFWLWRSKANKHLNQNTSSVQGAYTEQQLSQSTDSNSIPLSPNGPVTKPKNSLSVDSGSSANNLGQLTPNSDGTNNGSSNNSSASKQLDPTTFIQYDKYKDGNSAMFAEIQEGNGDELTAGKKAAVYYKGWLTDGRLFDMTRNDKEGKPQPFVFEMGGHQVIPGWEQGLMGMKVGGTRLLIVPPAVGYGASGQDPIPGNAVLVFQVQLLAVQ
jgi:FKBP-type peptidyl-prolyl cis-trans isomerase FkpA